MKTYDILVNNGFNFEYFCSVEAVSWYAARKIFKARYAASYVVESFRVTLRKY